MGVDDMVNNAKEGGGERGDTVEEKAPGIVDNIKEDVGELKDIATGEGSISDKAKAALDAVKDHGGDDAAKQ